MKMRNELLLIITIIFFGVFSCKNSLPFVNETDPNQDEKPEEPKESKHPFLIVSKEMYPALREKSSKEPWKSMKRDAISRSWILPTRAQAFGLQEYIGAAALAYILDEEYAQLHANNVYKVIKERFSELSVKDGTWDGVVPRMSALFMAILALDIVYDALTEAEIEDCEKIISSKLAKVSIDGSWADARRGAHGTWNIYKGDRTTPDNDYYEGIMEQITPDGVSPISPNYAWARVGGSENEVVKSAYMDVLEFTGIDERYYNNERLIKFQRWLYGSSVDCARNYVIFGDILASVSRKKPAFINWRIVNFDHEAAQYAAWLFKGITPTGHILSYILPESALPEPKVPSSQIYENGGAFFRDKEDDPKGLQLTLYNIKSQAEWHTHQEVNGLSLSALGNPLLVNGGRLGSPVRAAHLNNTLTINGKDHASRLGGGIVDGFTSEMVDFAVGSTGQALGSTSHLRNSILVHNTTDVQGYFIVFDEVSAQNGDQVKNYLHPANETDIQVAEHLTEYIADIDHFPTVKDVSASFYYLTPAKIINIEKVPSATPGDYPGYPKHNRLEAIYDVNTEGKKNLATIIYPFGKSVSKAEFNKIEDVTFNACKISHGSSTDYMYETMSGKEIVSEGMKIRANFSLIRKVGKEALFYLVKNGTSFTLGNTGFQSDKKVTVYVNGKEGTIINNGAKVKLMGVGMGSVKFMPKAEVLSSGSDFIEVLLEKGTYSFE